MIKEQVRCILESLYVCYKNEYFKYVEAFNEDKFALERVEELKKTKRFRNIRVLTEEEFSKEDDSYESI